MKANIQLSVRLFFDDVVEEESNQNKVKCLKIISL